MAKRYVKESQRRALFDRMLEDELAQLPEPARALLEEVPVVVDDEPTAKLLAELGMEPDEDLCGLQSGVMLTERSVEQSGELPEQVHLLREPIIRLARDLAAERGVGFEDELRRQVHITLLHEIGHHFGLDEDQLDDLGYG